MIQYPEKSSLTKDLLFVYLLNFASRFLGVVHHRKGAWWQELASAGYIASVVRKQEGDECLSAA